MYTSIQIFFKEKKTVLLNFIFLWKLWNFFRTLW